MEQLATTSLYNNLAKENQIDSNVLVTGTYAMGRGSTQMGSFLACLGMNQDATIRTELGTSFRGQVRDIARKMYSERLSQPKNCKYVIALKSGFAMLLEDKANAWLLMLLQSLAKNQVTLANSVPESNMDIILDTTTTQHHAPEVAPLESTAATQQEQQVNGEGVEQDEQDCDEGDCFEGDEGDEGDVDDEEEFPKQRSSEELRLHLQSQLTALRNKASSDDWDLLSTKLSMK